MVIAQYGGGTMKSRNPIGKSDSQKTFQPPSASARDENRTIIAKCWKIIKEVTVSSDKIRTIAESATPPSPSKTGFPTLPKRAVLRVQIIHPAITGRK